MPWWEYRMWVECINEEFRPRDDDDDDTTGEAEVTDDLSSLGLSIHEIS